MHAVKANVLSIAVVAMHLVRPEHRGRASRARPCSPRRARLGPSFKGDTHEGREGPKSLRARVGPLPAIARVGKGEGGWRGVCGAAVGGGASRRRWQGHGCRHGRPIKANGRAAHGGHVGADALTSRCVAAREQRSGGWAQVAVEGPAEQSEEEASEKGEHQLPAALGIAALDADRRHVVRGASGGCQVDG